MGDLVRIASDALTADIDPFGAELTHLCDADGHELMTDADLAYWTGRAPLLFPIVGALAGDAYRLDGREYAMPKHGFARRRLFTISEQHETWACLTLEDDVESRRAFPRSFSLRVLYEIAATTLQIKAEIYNPDYDRDLPASFGFHPAFAWPLPYGRARADHRIVFERDEAARIARLDNGLIAAEDRGSPLDGRSLPLRDALFADDALVWLDLASDSVRYGAADGPQLEIAFPGAPMLGVWTKPGAAFVCIEPWWGHADPAGFTGEIWDKPGIMRLGPGERREFAMRVTLTK